MVYRHVSFRVLFLFVCFVSFYFLGGFVSFRVLFLFFRVGSVRLAFRVFSVRFDSFIVSAAIFLLQYQYQYIYIYLILYLPLIHFLRTKSKCARTAESARFQRKDPNQ